MEIKAALVKELRDRTGAGMMECKKALVEAEGDQEAAVDILRKMGIAKADRKAERSTQEGIIALQKSPSGQEAAMVEVNCETDFVAKEASFKEFGEVVASQILHEGPEDLTGLLALPSDEAGVSIDERRQALIATLGENISVRRFVHYVVESGGSIGGYVHGGRIGVLVELQGGDASLAKDLAMHIAANKPVCIAEQDVPSEMLEKEREVYLSQATESGKPQAIIEKMVEGRLKKFIKEVTLLGQGFVKDPETSVEQLLKEANAKVLRFQRFEVGEGKEKQSQNFAEEVMAQMPKDQ